MVNGQNKQVPLIHPPQEAALGLPGEVEGTACPGLLGLTSPKQLRVTRQATNNEDIGLKIMS